MDIVVVFKRKTKKTDASISQTESAMTVTLILGGAIALPDIIEGHFSPDQFNLLPECERGSN